jgi:uncharacterized membrane protein
MDKKSIGKILIVIGLALAVMGLIFAAQSKSALGPEASFMYNNPGWTVNGIIITGIGVFILASGVMIIWTLKK